jgi:hypothetical protein
VHDISNGRMAMGIGRGDSSRRVVGSSPCGSRSSSALRDDQGADERPRGRLEREAAEARVGAAELPDIPMWIAGYGPKALAVAGASPTA